MQRILVINPGSTSTKIAVFDDSEKIMQRTIRHSSEEIVSWGGTISQKPYRQKLIIEALEGENIAENTITVVVGRGGMIRPIESGVYEINQKMLEDLQLPRAAQHASALGGLIAWELGKKWGVPACVVDPVVVDEMEPVARFSGLNGIERRSAFHALNTKAVLRRAAQQLSMAYSDGRFIAVHMGGGVTVSAHLYGRVIDVNDGISGDGPFSPDRSGALPLMPMISRCFSGEYTFQQMEDMVQRKGGLYSYLGINDMQEAEKRVSQGDEHAAHVVDAMAYQICKDVGAMYAVLEGRVNAIVLTGGIAHSTRFTGLIKKRIDLLAKVLTFPGEFEMEALAEGALRVMTGEEEPMYY